MEPYHWIIVSLVFVLVIVVVARLVSLQKRRRVHKAEEKRRIDECNEWLMTFKAASTDEELAALHFIDHEGWRRSSEIAEAEKLIKAARERKSAKNAANQKAAFDQFKLDFEAEKSPSKQLKLIQQLPAGLTFPTATIHYWLLPEEARQWIDQQEALVIPKYAALLLEEARAGNGKSFHKLVKMVTGYDRGSTLADYAYPVDWADLVAQFYKLPKYSKFGDQPKRLPKEVSLMAAEALRTSSLTLAKLVLAYCDDSYSGQDHWGRDYRKHMGDLRYGELYAMVDAIHAERGLFQEALATPVVE